MAKEAKIESVISEEFPEKVGSQYWNLLSVEVTREDGTRTKVKGAVFGNTPHIVQVDDFSDLFAFRLIEGPSYILAFKNQDRPGAISEVLEILQRANVNIASMNVARAALPPPLSPLAPSSSTDSLAPTGGMALCFMALDDDVSTNAMNSLLSLSFLQNVNKIQLQ